MLPTFANEHVAAVIPTYNRKEALSGAIESVLQQTRPADELVVVDDGSTDGTARAVASRFGTAVRLVRQPRRGVAAARNAGVRASTAALVAFLDSDDTWLPDKLAVQLAAMEDGAVLLSATNWRWKTASQSAFAVRRLALQASVLRSPLAHLTRGGGHGLWPSTWIVRRDAFWSAGGFDENLRVAEDTEFIFRLAWHGSFALVPEVLAERSSAMDAHKLTNFRDFRYLRELSDNTVAILLNVCHQIENQPRQVRRAAERRLSYHLRRQLEYLALDGRSREARKRAFAILSRCSGAREKLTALAAIISPPMVGARKRRSLLRRGVEGLPTGAHSHSALRRGVAAAMKAAQER